jgi:hypothetical protein
MIYRFHCNVFAWPSQATEGPPVELRRVRCQTLQASVFHTFLPVTFEQTVESLQKLPRLDAEPDGYFVIAGDHDGQRWQVDGHLFDFSDRLHRVELHGACPVETFDALLSCFGWPEATLAFSLVMEGVTLDEPSFRRWAGVNDEP